MKAMNPLNPMNPKKLLLSKWTAVVPMAKQKHFLVSRVIQPEQLDAPVEQVELEAVFSKATQVIAWRDLQDTAVWRQGWV
jgi:tryptophan-rich hypothetical protein